MVEPVHNNQNQENERAEPTAEELAQKKKVDDWIES